MSQFEPSEYSGPPAATVYKDEAVKEQKLSAGLSKASAAVAATGAAAAVVAPPWSLIVTAAAAATSLGVQVASKVSGRNAKALTGDEAAIAPFIKHAAKMKSAQRKKKAEALLKQLKRHEAKKNHKPRAWKVRDNVLKMKLGALYAAENHAGKHPNKPLDPDGPTPAEVEAQSGILSSSNMPMIGVAVGVVALGAVALYVKRRSSVPVRTV